jgi:hypothetical protein
MSPEQARAQPVDARSDLFSLGTVLYEMLAGQSPFRRDTAADTVSAILHQDPPEITTAHGPAPAGLERVVRRCLEKDPQERFRSAMDVAFALDVLSSGSGVATTPVIEAEEPRLAIRLGAPRLALVALTVLALLFGGLVAAWILGQRSAPPRLPEITKLTFRNGAIGGARFAPGGRTVVYTGLFDGGPSEIFRLRVEDPNPESLGLAPARILAVSSRSELAVVIREAGDSSPVYCGTLARVPLSGGRPRPLVEWAISADWSPDGRALAVLRSLGPFQTNRLEYPIGTVLLEETSPGDIRVSPEGDRVALLTVEGDVVVVDGSGNEQRFETPLAAQGLAWDPGGEALWTSAGRQRSEGGLHRVTKPEARSLWRLGLDGSWTEVYRVTGGLALDDVSSDGRMLVHHGIRRDGVRAKAPGEPERELKLSAWAALVGVSADGTQVLTAENLPWATQAYLRPVAGGPGTRVVADPPSSDVIGMTLDARWVLVERDRKEPREAGESISWHQELNLVPTGPGNDRVIPTERFAHLGWVYFEFNGTLVAWAAEIGREMRGWMWSPRGGNWSEITPEGVMPIWIRWPQNGVVGWRVSDRTYARYPLDGGPSRPFPGSIPPWLSGYCGASSDGRFGYLYSVGEHAFSFTVPSVFQRIDLETGERTPLLTLQPEDRTGVISIGGPFPPLIHPDQPEEAYAYNYTRRLESLYLLEGLR